MTWQRADHKDSASTLKDALPGTASRNDRLTFACAGALLAVVLTWGPNPLLAAYAIAVLLAAFLLLWRPGESPVLLLLFSLQWLQASVKVLHANLQGLPLEDVAQFGSDIATSIGLSLTGLLMLATGMRYGAGPSQAGVTARARATALSYPASRWFTWYVIALIAGSFAQALAQQLSALSQPLLAFATLKWTFFFMLTFAAFAGPAQSRAWWLAAFATELMLGLGGFFADFRSVFLFSAMGLVAAGVRLTLGRTLLFCIVGTLTIACAIVWTAVKPEYRSYISSGQEAQIVEVSYSDSVSYLGLLISDLDRRQLDQGAEDFLNRLSYVDFFGAVVDYVPAQTAHTDGAIWLDAIIRPFMPRLLFPEKAAIHDSVRTAEFTGLEVAGVDRGASISIGYMGESYIDFGAIGMMVPSLLLGYALGLVYRWLVVTGPMQGLLGMGMASAALMAFSFLESSITKVVGGFVATLLVIWLLQRLVVPRWLGWLVIAPPYQAPTPVLFPPLR